MYYLKINDYECFIVSKRKAIIKQRKLKQKEIYLLIKHIKNEKN